MKPSLPNLLVIGAMKSGSTSLHDYLNSHPDIFMSETKELNFFIEEASWSKGLEWYKDQFVSDAKWKGESSISYTKAHEYRGVPDRIFDVLGGDVKMIYILRDPIKRFESNFTDGKTYRDVPPDYSINDYAKVTDNPYLMTSNYHYQINAYLEKFKLENILFLTSEELQSNPLKVLNEIADFLAIESFDKYFVPGKKLNVSNEKQYKNKLGERISGNALLSGFKRIFPTRAIRSVSGSRVYKKLIFNKIDVELDRLDEASIEVLKEYFREEMSKLRKLTNKNFDDWMI